MFCDVFRIVLRAITFCFGSQLNAVKLICETVKHKMTFVNL